MILEGWAQFESTGRIEDYLNYSRSCQAAGGAVAACRAESGPSAGGTENGPGR